VTQVSCSARSGMGDYAGGLVTNLVDLYSSIPPAGEPDGPMRVLVT
jgi:hypothetical protein